MMLLSSKEYIVFAATLILLRQTHAQTTVTSPSGTIFNCPQQETIEIAYQNYCPTTNRDGTFDLSGKEMYITYENAPTSYKTTPFYFAMRCDYGDQTTNGFSCYWFAGGGESLTPQTDSQDARCPEISSNVPQASPGVDYRRRSSMGKRDQFSPRLYTCPWDSNNNADSLGYITGSGFDVGQESEITHSATNYYYCAIGPSDLCKYYYEDDVFLADVDNIEECPSALCSAQYTGIGNMKRGIYQDDISIARRQVKTSRLRARAPRHR